MTDRRVVCAAMRCKKTGKIIASVRLWDEICHQAFPNEEAIFDFDDEQGFLDNRYNFLTREEAWPIAEAAGQIIRRVGGDFPNGKGRLYSENLY